MPNFTITVPAGDLTDTIEAFSAGWVTHPEGLTRQQYAKREIRNLIVSTVRSYRHSQQAATEPDIEVT